MRGVPQWVTSGLPFNERLDIVRDEDYALQMWAYLKRENFGKAFKYTKRDLISEHKLIVSTPNTAVCEDIRGSFGSNAIGIVVIEDEATMEQEPNAWCPLIKLDYHHMIRGLIMVGDHLQLPPTIISDGH